MADIQAKLREVAKDLLEKGEVQYIIGWENGRFANQTTPVFVSKAEDADKLIFNEYCVNTLAKYVMDNKYTEGKIGVCVRGCDSRAINRLITDRVIKREQVYLIGLPCSGMKDWHTDEVEVKCQECRYQMPVDYDVLVGDAVENKQPEGRFSEVEKIEAMTPDERYAYFAEAYEKCIRCYACRNVCPCCNCKECYADQYRVGWQGKQNNTAQNQIYGLTRAYHVGDRCIECGECARVCPVGLPLMALNRKLIKDSCELFGEYDAGLVAGEEHITGTYKLDDREEFM